MLYWSGEDIATTTSLDIREQVASATGFVFVYYWIGIRTVGSGAAVQFDSTCTDGIGNPLVMSSDGRVVTIDGSSASAKSGLWLVHQDGSTAWTFDMSYFSPFSDMRYDYQVWANLI